ncbi:hypothetical protein TB1_015139 [Malus domestica]
MPPQRPSVNVPELSYLVVDVLRDHRLHRRVRRVIQLWKNGLGAVPGDREPAAIGVVLGQCLGERRRLFLIFRPICLRIPVFRDKGSILIPTPKISAFFNFRWIFTKGKGVEMVVGGIGAMED